MKSSLVLPLSATLLVGCVARPVQPSTARPFAVLYGTREAQWLSSNQRAIFSGTNDPGSFHEVEIDGFSKLDAENQKLYMVVRFCTHQPANAEDGSQMWRLMSALKCPKEELADYIASLDEKALELYAAYLDGSIGQFHKNAGYYLPQYSRTRRRGN